MTRTGLELRGVFSPLTTPFDAGGGLDTAALAENVKKYNGTALAGYVAVGSTGESVLLGEDEKIAVWETVKEAAAPEKVLIAGTGAESTAETIALTRRAAEAGYQVALVRTPSYYRSQMTDAAQERHFLAVAGASPIPVLIYAVPQFTGLPVTAELVERLARHENILGIKESSGDLQLVAGILRRAGPGFRVLVGSATTFYPSLTLGARGGILAVSCALPELCTELYDAAAGGDHDRARKLQERLHEPTVALTSRYGIAGLKYAMDLRGYAGGVARAPLLPPDDAARAGIERVLEHAREHAITAATAEVTPPSD